MPTLPAGVPFHERGGRLRGVLDLASGRYPSFLFGRPIGPRLPVFHFHAVTIEAVEPAFRYLHENGYRTVTSDEAARFVREGRHPGPRTVMLTFDDAWASLWFVVAPLLDAYDLRVVTYAIPGRLRDAGAPRPVSGPGVPDVGLIEASDDPFVSWPELEAMAASGRVDVQSHTFSHAMVFTGGRARHGVTPGYARQRVLVRPRLDRGRAPEFLSSARLGFPMFPQRSRMADGRRFWPDPDGCARAEAFVAARGGAAFFDRPGWEVELRPVLAAVGGRLETDAERRDEIERELTDGRELLESRLRTPIRHVCLPWGVTGRVTRAALERLGVVTAFANRLSGQMAVSAGDDPFFLKRLPYRYIFTLPGRGRRTFVQLVRPPSSTGPPSR